MIPMDALEAAEEAVIDAMIKYGPDGHIDGYQEIARAALEAASPYLMAQAWDEGAEAEVWPDCAVPCGACDQCRAPATANPYRSQV